MAITLVDSDTYTGSTTPAQIDTSTLTLSSNDFIFILINRNASGSDIADNNTDAFTRKQFNDGAGSNALAIFGRFKVGSEPANWEFTLGSNQSWAAIVFVFSGVDQTTPWDIDPSDANSNSDTSGTSATATTLNTNSDDAMAISISVTDNSSDKYTGVDNSFTNRTSVGTRAAQAAIKTMGSSGSAIGATIHTLSGTDDWYAEHMALKAATGGASNISTVKNLPLMGCG